MTRIVKTTLARITILVMTLCCGATLQAWEGMAMPELHVDGRYLVDSHGNVVNLHGFAQTYSPWFNEQGTKWTNYDVSGCLKYNKEKIDQILAAGWKMNFIRLHMDPYWSNRPGVQTTGENDISAFDFDRFTKYLNQVFIPMAEYAISKGLYVVMRPPGVCPEKIAIGDNYQKYLIKVWKHVASHIKLKNHPNIMFELANEPIHILGTDGTYGGGSMPHFENMTKYFQEIVDVMRAQGCNNILWVPGLGYQSQYAGYATFPIKGDNIGYAVHVYPGWYGSDAEEPSHELGGVMGGGYEGFQKGWDAQVKPAADFAPIMVTEMDWAPAKYNASWGKSITGVEKGTGFGANFKYIADNTGNVSWLIFTGCELLAQFKDNPGNGNTFLTDPEACPWPTYHWYQEYSSKQVPKPEFTLNATSDNGDGTFNNPVLFGDFPDPDVIRVGDTYYMVSTTMHIFPGATILKSKDLVNWEYCANPLERIESTDDYNLENGKNRYGHGQWATALQYNNGVFYMLFNTLEEGGYLLTASDPEGEWEKKKLPEGFYDCGLMFDGDKAYVAYGISDIHIAQIDNDFKKIKDQVVAKGSLGDGLEGSRLYHIGNYYYIYATYPGWPGRQTILRASDIWGPYEERMVLADQTATHQGALVQTAAGEWWTMLFRDNGALGRTPYLLPVKWENNWPVIGTDGKAGDKYTKPNTGTSSRVTPLPTTDVFRHYKLSPQWGWNHNSDQSRWSLTKRAGYMRIYTASVTDNPYEAKNTLTQRILAYHQDKTASYGTAAIDISHMADGDICGLGTFQDPLAFIGVEKNGTSANIVYRSASLTGKQNPQAQKGNAVTSDIIYLRAVASYTTGKAKFYFSTDNVNYTQFGPEFKMEYDLSVFTGNKFAIFNYATKELGGYIDIDWFSTEPTFTEDTYYDPDFKGYSEESLTVSHLEIDTDEDVLTLLTGSSRSITVSAVFMDGHVEDVTMAAAYKSSDESIVKPVNGRLTALRDGYAQITVSYQGGLGEPCSLSVGVSAQTFPFVNGLFNPSIWETGTFNEETHEIKVGKYGFAGWKYSAGIDLSAYKYCVAKLSGQNTDGVSFRLFDIDNYWSDPSINSFNNDNLSVVKLGEMYSEQNRKLDPSHIYIVGFWGFGNNPFVIEKVYLTNSDDLTDSIDEIIYDADEIVDVYTVTGILLRSSVRRAEAVDGLPDGIYIVGHEKIAVKH